MPGRSGGEKYEAGAIGRPAGRAAEAVVACVCCGGGRDHIVGRGGLVQDGIGPRDKGNLGAYAGNGIDGATGILKNCCVCGRVAGTDAGLWTVRAAARAPSV